MSVPEVSESGYSSEKPSAVTSPVCQTELCTADQNINTVNLNVSPVENTASSYSFDYMQITNENRNNFNSSPSPTDVQMTDLSEEKNEKTGLSLSTSLTVNSDVTSPEGPTVSPLSSPLTSKDSPTSPISSTIDGDDMDKVGKLVLRLDTEKRETSDKEDSLK